MAPSGTPGDLPDVLSLTKHGALLGGPHISPDLAGSKLRILQKN